MSSLAERVAELERYTFELLAPAPRLEVWEWAEKNIYLDERTSAMPGKFSTALTPYIREPLQCYADKSITDLTLCFGTQTAKTTVVMVGTAYRIVNDPMPALWVMPNKDLANSFSKTRWKQMVDDCRPLCDQKPADRHRYGNLEQHFHKVTLNFVGSNSPSNLASRPAGLLNMDETDKFKLESEREAGALQLAEERTKTFPYPLRVKTSTPTTVHGAIWKEFEIGDQRYYFVPCPHCSEELEQKAAPGTFKDFSQIPSPRWECLSEADRERIQKTWITLKFRVESEKHGDCGLRWWRESESEVKKENGEWDYAKVRKGAFYKCQNCGGDIRDEHKQEMLRQGVWVPTNPTAEPNRRSYHLSSLYSLLGRECMFGAIAVKWLQTRGSITKKHNFINSTLAETWDDERAVDDNAIFRESYSMDELPEGRTRLMSIDVQENHFWVVIRDWLKPTKERPHGESWQLFADRVETIEEVVGLQREFRVESKYVVADTAHFTNRVCKWLVQHDWRGLWGQDKRGFAHVFGHGQRVQMLWSPVQYRDPHLGTAFQSEANAKAMYCFWANDPVKDLLAVLMNMQNPALFHISAQAHKDYQRHINAEQRVVKRLARSGGYFYSWHQFYKQNHLRDCELMNLVRALQLGLAPTPDGAPREEELTLSA